MILLLPRWLPHYYSEQENRNL